MPLFVVNKYHCNVNLQVPFTPVFQSLDSDNVLTGTEAQQVLEKGFTVDNVNREFIEWLNSRGLSISPKRWNRYFVSGPNKRLNIHADTHDPLHPRTKLNIMFNCYDIKTVFYDQRTTRPLQHFIKGSIRIYPEALVQEVYSTTSCSPCIFNSTEIHTAFIGENKQKMWVCYSLNLTDLNQNNVTFQHAAEALADCISS